MQITSMSMEFVESLKTSTGNNNFKKDDSFKQVMASTTKESKPELQTRDKERPVAKVETVKTSTVSMKVTEVTGDAETEKVLELDVTEAVLNVVASGLGITVPELVQVLEQLDIDPVQLLDVTTLQAVTLEVTGETDLMSLLANEEVSEAIKNMFAQVKQIKEGTFTQVLEEIQMTQEADIVTSVGQQDLEQVDKSVQGNIPNQNGKLSQNDNNTSETVNEPVITVEKEVQAQKGSSSNADHNSQQQSSDESSQSLLNSFIQNVSAGTNVVQNEVDPVAMARVQEYEMIVEQIVEQIKIVIKPEASSIQMQLRPEHLGNLSLQLVARENGLTAQFTVQNAAVKEAIESQLVLLKQSLVDQGVKVESIHVTVANDGYQREGENRSHKDGKSKKNFMGIDELDALDGKEEHEEIMNIHNSQIDYTV